MVMKVSRSSGAALSRPKGKFEGQIPVDTCLLGLHSGSHPSVGRPTTHPLLTQAATLMLWGASTM